MKLKATISGEEYDVRVERHDDRLIAEVDGRQYELESSNPQNNRYVLIHRNRVFNCIIESKSKQAETFEVRAGNSSYVITLTDPRRLRSERGPAGHHDGAAHIIAPMPGKVVRLLVQAGAEVKTGDGILVVEAMKMQNEMKSPRAGTVTTLNVQQGTTVNAGDLLAVIE
jgi:biotin carboxyl carrier protein